MDTALINAVTGSGTISVKASRPIPSVPKKCNARFFVTLILKNIAYILISSDKTLSYEKNNAKII